MNVNWYTLDQSIEVAAVVGTFPSSQEFRMSDMISQARSEPLPGTEPHPYAPDVSRPAAPKPRVWPGLLIVAGMWLAVLYPRFVEPTEIWQMMLPFFAPMVATVAFVLWWVLVSRLRWRDRPLSLLACAALGAGAFFLYDPTVNGSPKYNPFALIMLILPWVTTAWVAALVVTPFLGWGVRQLAVLAAVALAWGAFALIRIDGVDGTFHIEWTWRWTRSAEERHRTWLASQKQVAPGDVPSGVEPGDWPGFRGPHRDGRAEGVSVGTDWDKNPPHELWRHPVGPGWGSFAAVGDHLYTQEQRDDKEAVVCYRADNGGEVWAYTDDTRFTETVSGAGPRATPTFHAGKIYALGANGVLNCLDAKTGAKNWSHDIVADSGAAVPTWGFSSSPLVAKGVVTVFAGGPDGKGVLGYDAESGALKWYAGKGRLSYCSPQLTRIDGTDQVLIATDAGLTSFDPVGGDVLWHHDWQTQGDLARIIQPALVGDGDVLLGTGMTVGTRRVHVGHTDDGWKDKEVWTTKAIKPYFNDLVVYDGHLYGFDNNFLTCVSLADGKLKWRERGYGNGQVLLLPDQGLLLVLAEKGAVALVQANPTELKELGRIQQALEGKTWNHPVVSRGKLFVRNGEEMACYQLPEAK
jgi:outer membrane protein assembly factor BamB